MARLVLASASPRRRALLDAVGLPHEVRPAPAGTEDDDGGPVRATVLRLARLKAEAVARGLGAPSPTWVLAADTLGELDDKPLGKPRDDADAERILKRLAGRTHDVVTGVVVLRVEDERVQARAEDIAVTRVHFLPLASATIRAYVATGEPRDKAAAYGVQGRASAFIDRIDGSWSNVVGLPLHLVPRLLASTGYPLPPHLVPGKEADSAWTY
jgi:septum formation protein